MAGARYVQFDDNGFQVPDSHIITKARMDSQREELSLIPTILAGKYQGGGIMVLWFPRDPTRPLAS